MHPEIENLINMALADGEVTEKERAVILRKAESLGIDKDEVEMILDAKLHQLKTKANESKKENVNKCPSCGDPEPHNLSIGQWLFLIFAVPWGIWYFLF